MESKLMKEDFYKNHPSEEYIRRNISGIYFFDTFPGEEKRKPTAFEDCSVEKQEEVIADQSKDWLKSMILLLSRKLKEVSIYTDITTDEED